MKRRLSKVIAWILVFALLNGMTGSLAEGASEIMSDVFSLSGYDIQDEAPDVPASAEVEEARDLLAFLGEGTYAISFADADTGTPVEKTDDGKYVLEENREYILRFDSGEVKDLPKGTYYLQFPTGLTDGKRDGNLTLEHAPGSAWSYDPDSGLMEFVITDDCEEANLYAEFHLTFTQVRDDIEFSNGITVEVTLPEGETKAVLEKEGYSTISKVPADVRAAFNDAQPLGDDYENIVWCVTITNPGALDEDSRTLRDEVYLGGGRYAEWEFSADDQKRGLLMRVTTETESYLVDVSKIAQISWSADGWSFDLPDPIPVDGGAIALTDIGTCEIYFTSTTVERIGGGSSSSAEYRNRAWLKENDENLDKKGTVTRKGTGIGKTAVHKKGTADWDAPSITWRVYGELPTWDGKSTPLYDWRFEDEIKLRHGFVYDGLTNHLNNGTLKMTVGGEEVKPLGEATGNYAYRIEPQGTVNSGSKYATLWLYHLCTCDQLDADIPDHETIDGYCTQWTVQNGGKETIGFEFTYVYGKDELEEIYDIAGAEIAKGGVDLRNSVDAYHSNGVKADGSSDDVSLGSALEKQLVAVDDEDCRLEYKITINENHREYGSDMHSLVIRDKMDPGLNLESLIVEENGKTLDSSAYRLEKVGDGWNEFEVTILNPGADAKYVLYYTVIVDTDVFTGSQYSNEVQVVIFGQTLSIAVNKAASVLGGGSSHRYQMLLTKESALDGSKRLSGATFAFGALGGASEVTGLTTDQNGRLTIDKASLGRALYQHQGYYIRETAAPAGFEKSDAVYWFVFCRDLVEGKDCEQCNEVIRRIRAGNPGAAVDRIGPKDAANTTTGTVTFKNTPYVAYAPAVEKKISGQTPAEDSTFTFTLAPRSADSAKLPQEKTLTVTGEASKRFGAITFTEPGTYTFEIRETKGSALGYTYDEKAWLLTVDVRQNDDGTLSESHTYTRDAQKATDEATFTNSYAPAQTTLTPEVDKRLTGASAVHAGMEQTFAFTLAPAKTGKQSGFTLSSTRATVKGGGSASFKPITFTEAGDYAFEIAETAGDAAGYTYDGTPWTLNVSVKDVGGELTVDHYAYTRSGAAAAQVATFTNTYSVGDLTLRKTVQVAQNDTLDPNAAFTFTVTLDDETIDGQYGEMRFARGVATVTLKHGESATAKDLPAGIAYTVTEAEREGYEASATGATGTIESGAVATVDFVNVKDAPTPTPEPEATEAPTPVPTLAPTPTPTPEPMYTSVAGEKTWDDNDDEGGNRPDAIVVRLLQNGALFAEQTVTAESGWRYSFDALPMLDENANPYVYTISEQLVSGYYTVTEGYDLINRPVELPPETIIVRRLEGDPGVTLSPLVQMNLTEEALEELIDLFDYETPLFGMLLGTGDELPVYPFAFAGVGALALIALLAADRKRRQSRA